MSGLPGGIRNGPLCDHPHLFRARAGQGQVDRFLVGNVDGSLEGVKGPRLDREAGGLAVAAVTDKADVAALARSLQRGDGIPFLQDRFGAAVQKDEVEPVGLEPAQAALDRFEDGIGRPIGRALHPVRMAHLGKKMKLVAPMRNGFTDELLAVAVALRGIDHVETGIEARRSAAWPHPFPPRLPGRSRRRQTRARKPACRCCQMCVVPWLKLGRKC